MLLYVSHKPDIGIGEAKDHFQNQTGIRDRRIHVFKLIKEKFETITICFGGGKIFEMSVAKLVFKLNNP